MMEQEAALLKKAISDYKEFCNIAEKLDWIDVGVHHEDWWNVGVLGIYVDTFEFPKGYIESNLVEAYVRTVLSSMAIYEEWDKNYWDIPLSERRECLEKGQWLYESYAVFKEIRLKQRDWNYLANEVRNYADENGIAVSKQEQYIDIIRNSFAIELSGDFEYLAIKNNLMLIVTCGCWD